LISVVDSRTHLTYGNISEPLLGGKTMQMETALDRFLVTYPALSSLLDVLEEIERIGLLADQWSGEVMQPVLQSVNSAEMTLEVEPGTLTMR